MDIPMPDAIVSAAGLRVLKLLVGNAPQTVSDLIRSARVTRTAVTEQLNELVAAGFVERATQPPVGRGRPRHLYRATNAALVLLFANNQHLVVPAIWRAIDRIGGDELAAKVRKQVSRSLADHYNAKITAKKPQERLRQLIGLLTAEGGLIEAVEDKGGQLVLYKRSCPFISMVDPRRSVCHIDQEMMTAVVGRPVRQTACRHEGSPCCTFEIVEEK
jgi:predicted ArsR family transcriptional regulator